MWGSAESVYFLVEGDTEQSSVTSLKQQSLLENIHSTLNTIHFLSQIKNQTASFKSQRQELTATGFAIRKPEQRRNPTLLKADIADRELP